MNKILLQFILLINSFKSSILMVFDSIFLFSIWEWMRLGFRWIQGHDLYSCRRIDCKDVSDSINPPKVDLRFTDWTELCYSLTIITISIISFPSTSIYGSIRFISRIQRNILSWNKHFCILNPSFLFIFFFFIFHNNSLSLHNHYIKPSVKY